MAKKKKGDDAAEGEAPKKKKPIVPIVLILAGLFAGKTFFGGGSTTTPEQMQAQLDAEEKALTAKCAAWNGGEGGAAAHEESSGDAESESTPAEDAGESHGAAGAGEVQLIGSSGRSTVRLASEAAAEGEAAEKPVAGPVLEVDPKTINLRDGAYLKVGFAIQLAEGQDVKLAKDEGKGARAVDIALERLQLHTMDDLLPPVQRSALKHKIGAEICQAYNGEVLTIYFTEFVMQE